MERSEKRKKKKKKKKKNKKKNKTKQNKKQQTLSLAKLTLSKYNKSDPRVSVRNVLVGKRKKSQIFS